MSTAVAGLAACGHAPPPPVAVAMSAEPLSFVEDVQPIFESRCVVCHSCYNSPCQLKLSSFEGLDRGGTDQLVYDSARLQAAVPTRLFTDAQTTDEWRQRGFHSVVENTAEEGLNNSIMIHLLDARMHGGEISGEFHAEADDLTCAADGSEVGQYLDDNPNGGMPFGFPALADVEYETIAAWLQQGTPGPTVPQQRALITPSPEVALEIAKWEGFLNQPDAKHAMTARYLYEHYFLAHMTFVAASPLEFYELVRSRTPSGRAVEVIATRRPYDAPVAQAFYYRFRKIHSTIVHKTHIVVELDDERLARLREQFIGTEWLETPHRIDPATQSGADPFVVFAQIPPKVRYQFLLDHSEYVIRTFIRGPVCKGQIALNVIRDHFWVMFLDPEADATLDHPEFLVAQSENLRLPNEVGSDERLLRLFSDGYRNRYARYYRAKAELYESVGLRGFAVEDIWRGERAADAPMLTVYRHFDSASVHRGAVGGLPSTAWVIDYAQFERIYYGLVAGFDVFGNVSHQLNVRRYMDYLRMEGELNFLQFMPRETRIPTMRSWYLGDGAFENVEHERVFTGRDTQVVFETDDPVREFIERVVDDHLLPEAGITFDDINFRRAGVSAPAMPTEFDSREDLLTGFRALTAPGTGFIRHLSLHGLNIIYLRVREDDEPDHFVSIVINRWHDNVNSVFGEDDRLDPSRDTIDFIRGYIGSYPNYFFDVDLDDLPDFFDMMENFDGTDPYVAKLRRYGINRADPRFWEAYDEHQRQHDAADPIQAGVLDLNRYYATVHEPAN